MAEFEEDFDRRFDWAEFVHNWWFRGKKLLRKFWWILILTTTLGVGYMTWKEMQQEPVYRSQGRLILRGQIAVPEGNTYREQLANFFGTQLRLMQSSRVQRAARARVEALHPDLEPAWVNLSARQEPDTSIFNLTVVGGEPRYVQAYLNAVMEEFIKFRREMRMQTSESSYLAISDELLRLEEEIERREQAMVDFQRENNIVFLQEQGTSAGTYLAQLNTRIARLRSQLRELESLTLEEQLTALSVGMTDQGSAPVLDFSESNRFLAVKNELDALRANLSEFSIYLRDRHPKIINLRSQIERKQNELSILRDQAEDDLETRKDVLRTRIKNLETEIAEWEVRALENGRRLAEYQQLQRLLNLARDSYERLQETLQSIDLGQNLEQELIGIFEEATVASSQVGNLTEEVVKGGVLGFAAGLGIIVFIGLLDNRVFSIDDLTSNFEEPVLGVIPIDRSKGSEVSPLRMNDPRHMFAEAVRNLRSSVLFMEKNGRPPQVLLVTSAVPSEGKSTIASNLAVALSMTQASVLLIDCDLRRGHLHRQFEVDKSPGFSELLEGSVALESALHRTDYDGLSFLACGTYPDRPGELLLKARLDDVVQNVRQRFDYIVFDSAPLLATDDTSSFANKVDAILFTVRSGFTQVRQVRPAVERLKMRNTRIAGFVLNYVDSKTPNYYYYKYYDYYTRAGGKTQPPFGS
ncbi:MAG: GumC family protein [Opitutales bacterium]